MYPASWVFHPGDDPRLVKHNNLIRRNKRAGFEFHHGHDRLSEAFVGNAYNHGVANGRIPFEGFFHFLGEHFFPAGINANRSPSEKTDRPVGVDRRPIAGD